MTNVNLPYLPRKLSVLVHGLGISSLGSALFLQSIVFTNILQNGYFRGVEQNPVILSSEIALTGFAMSYLAYMAIRYVPSNINLRNLL